jgi:hypothetical protein
MLSALLLALGAQAGAVGTQQAIGNALVDLGLARRTALGLELQPGLGFLLGTPRVVYWISGLLDDLLREDGVDAPAP